PSMFDKPVTVQEWEQAQRRRADSARPFLTISRVGVAPLWTDRKQRPGSGYWPAPDPPGGADAHAAATMKKYKPLEGKGSKAAFLPRGGERSPGAFAALPWDTLLAP